MTRGLAARLRATAVFRAERGEIPRLEEFVRGIGFLSGPDRDRLVLVSSEIMDNVISHSSPAAGSTITVRVSASGGPRMIFWFKGERFRAFAEAASRAAGEPATTPRPGAIGASGSGCARGSSARSATGAEASSTP